MLVLAGHDNTIKQFSTPVLIECFVSDGLENRTTDLAQQAAECVSCTTESAGFKLQQPQLKGLGRQEM